MSGEGASLSSSPGFPLGFAEIIEHMKAGKPLRDAPLRDAFAHADGSRECRPVSEAPQFDQRPGELEATRGLGARLDAAPIVAVGARHDGNGWRVQLLQQGMVLAVIDADAARALASDLTDMADVIEGRWS